MIATEIAQRYAQGESVETLAREYHLCKRNIAKTIRAMGGEIRPAGFDATRTRAGVLASVRKAHERRMASGEFCRRCEILLRFDPGQDGYCGECWEEGRGSGQIWREESEKATEKILARQRVVVQGMSDGYNNRTEAAHKALPGINSPYLRTVPELPSRTEEN